MAKFSAYANAASPGTMVLINIEQIAGAYPDGDKQTRVLLTGGHEVLVAFSLEAFQASVESLARGGVG